MSEPLSRRTFLGAAAVAAAGAAIPAVPAPAAPAIRRSPAATFSAVSSSNGLRAVDLAVRHMREGMDTLDAAVEGVKIQELDPNDMSVGYGGLPNAEGVVQLDASCMHGPTKRAGAVAALEGIRTPSEVARLVLRYTNHILLVGEGAKRFALSYGFREEELLTPKSREAWLRWRANRSAGDDWVDIPGADPLSIRPTGTINLNVLNDRGDLSSVTTTSGLAWKIPGRAGDSPLVGAGQYCDNEVGAARQHRARRGQHHGVRRVPHGRGDAEGVESHRCMPRDSPPCGGHDTAWTSPPRRATHLPTQFLRREQARGHRIGVTLSEPVRGA